MFIYVSIFHFLKTSERTTKRTIVLQISPFDKRRGCDQRVKRVLRELDGVISLEIDLNNGKLFISTVQSTEAIIFALKQEFSSRRKITILQNNSIVVAQRTSINPRTVNFNDVAQAMVSAPRIEGIESAEFTQTIRRGEFVEQNTLRLNFTNQERRPTTARIESGHNNVRVPRIVGSPVREFIIKLLSSLLKATGIDLENPERVIHRLMPLAIIPLVCFVVVFLIFIFLLLLNFVLIQYIPLIYLVIFLDCYQFHTVHIS